MTISAKKYKAMKEKLESLKLTVEILSDNKLVHEIESGIHQIESNRHSRVRDDIKI